MSGQLACEWTREFVGIMRSLSLSAFFTAAIVPRYGFPSGNGFTPFPCHDLRHVGFAVPAASLGHTLGHTLPSRVSAASTLAGNVSALATAEHAALGNATCDAPARHDLRHVGFAVPAASLGHTLGHTLPSRVSAASTLAGNVSALATAEHAALGNATCDTPARHDLYHRGLAVSAASFVVQTSPPWMIVLNLNLLGEIGIYFGFNPTAVTVLRRDISDLNRRSVRLHLRILSRRRNCRAKPDQQSNVKRLLYYVGALALLYVSVPLRMVLFIGWPILRATTRTARGTLFVLAYTIVTALHLAMVLLARTVLLCVVVASIIFAGVFAVAATALNALIMCLCFIWTPYSTSQKWFTRISVSAIDFFRHAIGSALLHMYLCLALWLPKPDPEDSSRPHASSDEGPLTASSRRTPDGMGASTSGDDGDWIRPPDYDSGAELEKFFRSPSPATSSVSSASTEWGSYGDDEALPPIPSHWSSSYDDEQSESEGDSEPIPEWVRHESIWCRDEGLQRARRATQGDEAVPDIEPLTTSELVAQHIQAELEDANTLPAGSWASPSPYRSASPYLTAPERAQHGYMARRKSAPPDDILCFSVHGRHGCVSCDDDSSSDDDETCACTRGTVHPCLNNVLESNGLCQLCNENCGFDSRRCNCPCDNCNPAVPPVPARTSSIDVLIARLVDLDMALAHMRAYCADVHLCAAVRSAHRRSWPYLRVFFTHWVIIILRCLTAASPLIFVVALALLPQVSPADTEHTSSSKPPVFSGQRLDFIAWFMAFSGFVAWRLTEAADILDEVEARPTAPLPRGQGIPNPLRDANNNVTNMAQIIAAATANAPDNQADIDAHPALLADWLTRNRKLYGLLMQAVPDWLRTSLYNAHRNDGLAAALYLRAAFDANNTADHAAQLARLQGSYIESRNDLSVDDLRLQYDSMMTATAAIRRTGAAPPADATLKAMFDNSLPMSYTHIRQLVRRQNHATFLAHYSDYMDQVRAELASRTPVAAAFVGHANTAGAGQHFLPRPPGAGRNGARGRGGGGRGDGSGGRGGGDGNPDLVCVNCGGKGHALNKCSKTKAKCKHCGAQHLASFCPEATGSHRRGDLSAGALNYVQRQYEQAKGAAAPAAAASAATAASAAAPAMTPATMMVDPAESARAHAAAAAAASGQADPMTAANTYAAALRSMGFGSCALASRALHLPGMPAAPPGAPSVQPALVDSMATYWVVSSANMLHTVVDDSPGFSIDTADGYVPVQAVGTALVHLWHGDHWRCYEVHNVFVLPRCRNVLYSTRQMRDQFDFTHHLDASPPSIDCPGAPDIPVTDDGSAFATPVAFVPRGSPAPSIVHRPVRAVTPLAMTASNASAAFPDLDSASQTQQATLYHRMAFPYFDQWRHVTGAVADHGLPPNVTVSTTIPVRDAVIRGRSRALPFQRPVGDAPQPRLVPSSISISLALSSPACLTSSLATVHRLTPAVVMVACGRRIA